MLILDILFELLNKTAPLHFQTVYSHIEHPLNMNTGSLSIFMKIANRVRIAYVLQHA